MHVEWCWKVKKMQQGYKQTEIGVIPADWEICVAKDLYLKARIGWQGLKKDEYLDDGDYYLVTGTDFLDNKISWKNCHYVSQERYDQDKNIQLSTGDILITKDGSIGKTAFVDILDKPATLNSGIFLVRPKNDKIDTAYLYFVFKCEYFNKFLNDLTAGSTIVHLYQKDFVAFKYPLPKRKEQEQIAKAIIDVDSMISSLEKLIEKKKAIKQGAMQELLTGKKRLQGFAGEWKKYKLGDLCCISGRIGFRGYTKKDIVNKGFGAITFSPSDIFDQKIDYSNCDYISFFKYEESPEIQVFNGDIIFCKTASIGKTALIKNLAEKATINPQFVLINNFKCNNKFLYYIISGKEFVEQILSITGGSTIPTISQEQLKLQLISMPTIEEQDAIASILSDMDNEIEALEHKLEKTRQIKQGMMQQLLTGKIRLV